MKKLMLTIVAAISLSSAFAQKGSVLYFGNIGGTNTTDKNATIKNSDWLLTTNHGLGYQVNDHITLGVQGGYGRYSSENLNRSNYSAGVFGRYTAYLNSLLFVYLHADAGYMSVNATTGGASSKTNGFEANLTPALGINVYKGWALNMNVGGIIFNYERSADYQRTFFNYNLGRGVMFGVSKNFHRSNKSATEQKG